MMSALASTRVASPTGAFADRSRPVAAVLFDLDGTLYAQQFLRFAMMSEMALISPLRAPWNPGRVPRVVGTFRRLRETLRDEPAAEPLARRQYTVVAEHLQCSPGEVERIVDEWMYRRPLKWLPYCRRAGIIELLDWLTARGVRRGVLSDYPAEHKLAALGLRSRFDLVLSTVDPDIGEFKPHPRGFLVAAEKWGLPPEQVLYVGDRPEVDAVGAAAAGMRCAVLSLRMKAVSAPDLITFRTFAELKRVLHTAC